MRNTSQIQATRRFDTIVDNILVKAVIRDDNGLILASFLTKLLVRFENREIELGQKCLVSPWRALLVVISELGATREDKRQDHEKRHQRHRHTVVYFHFRSFHLNQFYLNGLPVSLAIYP